MSRCRRGIVAGIVLTLALTGSPVRPDEAGGASIKGKVNFEGTPPKRPKIRIDAEQYCMDLHADNPPLKEDVVVNENGTLSNVIVYISKGLEGRSFPPSQEKVVLDQIGCVYTPHVVAVQVGQTLTVANSDPLNHNVHGLPRKNDEFNFSQVKKGQETPLKFKVAEFIKVKCDVHTWMGCYIGVFDHPFFAVTGADGTFELTGLPAGEYVVAAWQEKAKGTKTHVITVGAGESKEVDFRFTEEDVSK